jgi:site-specific recombinase XerD
MATDHNEQALSPLAMDMQGFLLDCRARGLSSNTLRIYGDQLRAFLAWCDVTTSQVVTANAMRRYFVQLAEHHNAGGVHQAYRVLKTFWRWIVNEGELEASPMARIAAPRLADDPLPPVALEDVRAMIGTCTGKGLTDTRDRALLLFLLDTGARASETVALDWQDVDLGSGAVMLRHTKGGRPRAAFLGVHTRKAALRYAKVRRNGHDGPVWIGTRGGRLRYWGLRQILRRRAARAGVKAPAAHAFRRAFCLAMLRGGADVFALKELAGHADLSTTRRYSRQIDDDLRAAHDKAGPVDRLLG